MVSFYLRMREDQNSFLHSLKGSIAEHIRRAIDDYIDKMRNLNVSSSKSKKGT